MISLMISLILTMVPPLTIAHATPSLHCHIIGVPVLTTANILTVDVIGALAFSTYLNDWGSVAYPLPYQTSETVF